MLILNDFSSEIKKTKEMNAIIQKLEITHSLIILDKISKEKIEKSVRNIPNIKITDVNHFSSYDIIKFKKVVFTESSVKELEACRCSPGASAGPHCCAGRLSGIGANCGLHRQD